MIRKYNLKVFAYAKTKNLTPCQKDWGWCTLFTSSTSSGLTFSRRLSTKFQAGLLTRDHSTFCTFPTKKSVAFMQISSRSQRWDRGWISQPSLFILKWKTWTFLNLIYYRLLLINFKIKISIFMGDNYFFRHTGEAMTTTQQTTIFKPL